MAQTARADAPGTATDASGANGTGGPTRWYHGFSTRQVLWPTVVMILMLAGLLYITSQVLTWLPRGKDTAQPELSLPILLITATIALLLSVTMILVVLARLRLPNKREALGLPQGSVRAIIALLLIVLFFITAVFLYSDVGRRDTTRNLKGVTAARLAQIDTDDIISMRSTGTGADERFTVELASRKDPASVDLAKQLVTTVSTLVVAVAAFYFGANSVAAAVSAKSELAEADRKAEAAKKEAEAAKAAGRATAGGAIPDGAAAPEVPAATVGVDGDAGADASQPDGTVSPPSPATDLESMSPKELDEFAAQAHAVEGTLNVTILTDQDPADEFERQEGAEDDEDDDDPDAVTTTSPAEQPVADQPSAAEESEADEESEGGQ